MQTTRSRELIMNTGYIRQLLAAQESLRFAGMAEKVLVMLLSWSILEPHLVI